MKKIVFFLLTALVVSSFSTLSIKADFNNSDLTENELINNRAVKLAKVFYPAEARKAKIQGKVLVRITVNQNGKVTEAQMIEGNPIFKEACQKAALASIFKPRIEDGKKIRYSGKLQYSFSIL